MNALARRLDLWSEPTLDGCRVWAGRPGRNGYGLISVNNRARSVHRVAYEVAKGEIAPGLCVMHRCDNRLCVNPEHLTLGTKADNSRDMVAKGRHVSPLKARTHCPQGHPHTGKTNNKGLRICAICASAANLRHRQKKAAQQ